jgi:hypothetical protein
MKESITQEDNMGCGAACVAFISDQTYHNSVEILGVNKARTVGYHLKELIDGLEHFGITSYFKRLKPKNKSGTYRQGLIVFIKRSTRYPYGHYLARHNDMWMDPWMNFPYDKDIKNAKSGYRKRLPGKAQYVIYLDK